jgi:hypothetical protein
MACKIKGKSVLARRQNQHARRVRYPAAAWSKIVSVWATLLEMSN